MARTPTIEAFAPWAGGLVGPLAWYAQQQGLGSLTYYACAAANPVFILLTGMIAAAAVVASGLLSRRAWRSGGASPELNPRRFVALVSMLAAAVFTLTILFQTLAGVLIPGCAR